MLHALATAALLPLAGPLAPDTLRRDWVAAEAVLVAHFDLAALAQSKLGSALLESEHVGGLAELTAWTEEHGIELGRDLRGMTVYVSPGEDAQPVLILSTSAKAEGLLEALPEGADHWTKTVEGRLLHSIDYDGERLYAHVVEVGRDARAIVLSPVVEELLGAATCVEGKAQSLAGSGSPLAALEPRKGSYAFVAVSDLARLPATDLASEMLKEAVGFTIDVGEDEGHVVAEGSVTGKSEEAARDIAEAGQGLVALARIIAGHEDVSEEVRAGRLGFLDSIRISSKGRTIRAAIRLPVDAIAALLEEHL